MFDSVAKTPSTNPMATAEDLDRSSKPSSTVRSLHRALGSGAVADVLLWRRRNAAALAVVGATSFWFLFERAGYSFLSLIANALLLLVTILFFWAKAASLLSRPLPPLPNLQISNELAGRAASVAHVWIDRMLSIAHDIAIKKDRKVFLEVTLVLWFVSYVGSFFNFLTLVYIGVLLILTVPALYDKYQDHIDAKLGVICGLITNQYDRYLSNTAKHSIKEKKAQ